MRETNIRRKLELQTYPKSVASITETFYTGLYNMSSNIFRVIMLTLYSSMGKFSLPDVL